MFQFQKRCDTSFQRVIDHLSLFRIAIWLLLSKGGKLDDFTKSTVK